MIGAEILLKTALVFLKVSDSSNVELRCFENHFVSNQFF